jgi:hypothetical protein
MSGIEAYLQAAKETAEWQASVAGIRCRRAASRDLGLDSRRVLDLTNAEAHKLKVVEQDYRRQLSLPPSISPVDMEDLRQLAESDPDGKVFGSQAEVDDAQEYGES